MWSQPFEWCKLPWFAIVRSIWSDGVPLCPLIQTQSGFKTCDTVFTLSQAAREHLSLSARWVRRDSARAAARRLLLTGMMRTLKEKIPIQVIKERSAPACKMQEGKWILIHWDQLLKVKNSKSLKFSFFFLTPAWRLFLNHWTVAIKVWSREAESVEFPPAAKFRVSGWGQRNQKNGWIYGVLLTLLHTAYRVAQVRWFHLF